MRQYKLQHDDPRIIPLHLLRRTVRDLSGQTFGRLTVLGATRVENRDRLYWLCSCSCGGEKLATRCSLVPHVARKGKGCTQSCGCMLKERIQSKDKVEPKVRKPRVHHYLEIEGCTRTVAEWTRLYHLPATTIKTRLNRGKTGLELIAPIKGVGGVTVVAQVG